MDKMLAVAVDKAAIENSTSAYTLSSIIDSHGMNQVAFLEGGEAGSNHFKQQTSVVLHRIY